MQQYDFELTFTIVYVSLSLSNKHYARSLGGGSNWPSVITERFLSVQVHCNQKVNGNVIFLSYWEQYCPYISSSVPLVCLPLFVCIAFYSCFEVFFFLEVYSALQHYKEHFPECLLIIELQYYDYKTIFI